MDVVARDQARRGQPVDKPVTWSVRYRDREHDQHREKDREMLARRKGLDGDNDKLLVEYQQDTDTDADMDMDSETDQPGEFNQQLKDCVDEPRRASRRVPRRESLRESLRAWLRVQVCLRESPQGCRFEHGFKCVFKCVYTQNENAASEFLENQLRVDNRECETKHVQMVHTSVALNSSNVIADRAVFHTQPTFARDAAKTKLLELWQSETCDVRINLRKARESGLGVRVGPKRECLSKWAVRLKLDRIDDDAEDERDEEVMCDCFFPQCKASLGASPLRKTDRV